MLYTLLAYIDAKIDLANYEHAANWSLEVAYQKRLHVQKLKEMLIKQYDKIIEGLTE